MQVIRMLPFMATAVLIERSVGSEYVSHFSASGVESRLRMYTRRRATAGTVLLLP